MERVALFGVGSPVVADVEETLLRLGIELAAAVANVPGEIYLGNRQPVVAKDQLTAEILATPFLVPLFTPAYRQLAADEARSLGFSTPAVVIDPTSILPRSLTCDEGVYINAGC